MTYDSGLGADTLHVIDTLLRLGVQHTLSNSDDPAYFAQKLGAGEAAPTR